MSREHWPSTPATVVELEPSAGGVERPVFRFADASGAPRTAVGAWCLPVLYAVGDAVQLRYDPMSDAVVEPDVQDRPGVARLLTPEGRHQLERVAPIELGGLLQVGVGDRRRRGQIRPRALAVSILSPGLRSVVAGGVVVLGCLLLLARMQLAAFFLLGYGFVLFARGRRSRRAEPIRDTYRTTSAGPVGQDPPDGVPPTG